MKKTITPRDLIYRTHSRFSASCTGSFLRVIMRTLFGKHRIDTHGVYRIGQTFGGRIAMY